MAFFWIAVGLLVVLVLVLRSDWMRSRTRRNQLLARIPGPMALPLLGNTLEINVAHDGNLIYLRK